ncbi:hypothetical protein [Neobacillus vireti]|uniref:hypothetical protein n=1 Tax=Neobacillus vireti TaxID=220686 RepID=UPI002FFEC1E6
MAKKKLLVKSYLIEEMQFLLEVTLRGKVAIVGVADTELVEGGKELIKALDDIQSEKE